MMTEPAERAQTTVVQKYWMQMTSANTAETAPISAVITAYNYEAFIGVGNPSMVTLRRSILTEGGLFDTGSRTSPEDWELWIRIAACGEIRNLPGPVVIYRWHSNNVTRRNRSERIAISLEISKRAGSVTECSALAASVLRS